MHSGKFLQATLVVVKIYCLQDSSLPRLEQRISRWVENKLDHQAERVTTSNTSAPAHSQKQMAYSRDWFCGPYSSIFITNLDNTKMHPQHISRRCSLTTADWYIRIKFSWKGIYATKFSISWRPKFCTWGRIITHYVPASWEPTGL